MFPMRRKRSQSLYLSDPRYIQTRATRGSTAEDEALLTCVAKSPMTAVRQPMMKIETQKQSHPPPIPNQTFPVQSIVKSLFVTRRWNKSEEEFPEKRHKMDHVIFACRRFSLGATGATRVDNIIVVVIVIITWTEIDLGASRCSIDRTFDTESLFELFQPCRCTDENRRVRFVQCFIDGILQWTSNLFWEQQSDLSTTLNSLLSRIRMRIVFFSPNLGLPRSAINCSSSVISGKTRRERRVEGENVYIRNGSFSSSSLTNDGSPSRTRNVSLRWYWSRSIISIVIVFL